MSTVALSPRTRSFGGIPTAAILMSALVSLGFFSLQGELAAFDGRPTILLVLDIAVGLLGMAALPLLRRSPVKLALGLSALLTVSASLTPAAGTAALWVAQRRRLPVAIAVGLAGVAGHFVRELWRPVPGRPLLLWMIVIVASYAALVGWGALDQARRALMASLRDRARRAEAEQADRVAEARPAERTRIAREMHDVLAHRLSLLATLRRRAGVPPRRAAGAARPGRRRDPRRRAPGAGASCAR